MKNLSVSTSYSIRDVDLNPETSDEMAETQKNEDLKVEFSVEDEP